MIDEASAHADKDKALLLVLTGNGKGKSSSAFGMLARALGHKLECKVARFIKSRTDTGEYVFFRSLDQLEWVMLDGGFSWKVQDLKLDTEPATKGWEKVKPWLRDPGIDLIVFDELTYLLEYGWLNTTEILQDLANRPAYQHVIITGCGAPDELIEAADTVSRIEDVKHAYRASIRAQPGVDW